MNKLYFITGNENKLREAKSIIPSIEGLNVDLVEIQSLDAQEIIRHKLEEARKKHNGAFIVEDVSLNIECLNGLPGPLIKWFLKSIGNDGIVRFVNSYGHDKATAKCIIGYSNEDEIEFFEGTVNGRIVEPRGSNKFGWDPIFEPLGYNKTFAEMSSEEKNAISHRRIAFEKLKEYLGE